MTTRESLAIALCFVGGAVAGPAIIHGAVWICAVYAAALGAL